jgi:hypothetical protein
MPRYEHENFGSVQDHTFMKGIITSVDSENDTADVTVSGGSNGSGVPIFYHCDPDSEERSNGAIEGASSGFASDDEVIVMCTVDGSPVRIVGFVDGIKECIQTQYLWVASALGIWRSFVTIWDAANEKVAEIEWEGESIAFPYDAPFMLKDNPGLPPVLPPYVEVSGTEGTYEDDPLYLWVMSRPWSSDVPEEEHNGVAVLPMDDGLFFSPDIGGVVDPDYAAGCSAFCGEFAPADSCTYSNSDEIPSRGEFGSALGLVNTGSKSGSKACTLVRSPPVITEAATGETSEDIAYSYAVLEPATDDWSTVTDSIQDHTPFVAVVVNKRSGEVHSALRTSVEISSTDTSENEYVNSPGGGDGDGCSGYYLIDYSISYAFRFFTPLGELDPISLSGGHSWNCQDTYWPSASTGCAFGGGDWVETLSTPTWTGLEGILTDKNMYHCKYTDKTLFQIYYYSTGWQSYSASGFCQLGWTWTVPTTLVTGDPVTSFKATVGWYPDDDAEDEDPTGMTSHSGFEAAIQAMFDATLAVSDPKIIYNLTAKIFN